MKPANPSRLSEFDDDSTHPGEPCSGSEPTDQASAVAALRDALRQVGQLKDFAAHYAAAKKDSLTAGIRSAALWGAVGAMAFLVGAGILITAGVLLVTGMADGLSRLLGTGPWAGRLLASGIILGLLALGAIIAMRLLRKMWHRQTEQKYEQRQLQQRIKHGQDVRQCATGQANDEANGH